MIYEIETIDNHIIFKENNLRLLLDTGSPISISNHSNISVFGKIINPHRKIMGNITIDNINCSIKNAKIDALIGGDILNKVNLYISISNKLIKLNPVIKYEEYDFFDISKILSIPTIDVKTKDRKIKMFIDTGAKNSYLNPKYMQLKNKIRIEEDFYPGFGEFKTNIYQHEIQIFNTFKKYDFGILPKSLEINLNMSGTNGIIGNNILMNFDFILDYLKNQILIKKSRGNKTKTY